MSIFIHRALLGIDDSSAGATTGVPVPESVRLEVGRQFKLDFVQFAYLKFTPGAVPAGIFNGIKLKIRTNAALGVWNQTWTMAVGLLIPDGIWDSIGAFSLANYPSWPDYPRPTDNSHNIINGVLFGDAWLGTAAMPAYADQGHFEPYDGEGFSGQSMVGLLSGTKAYMAAHAESPLGYVIVVYLDEIAGQDRAFASRETFFFTFIPELLYNVDAFTDPFFTSTPITVGETFILYVYNANADDIESEITGFFLDVAPAGMTIVEATGVITWTPTELQFGEHAVTVRVTDEHGGSATQSYVINVRFIPALRDPHDIHGDLFSEEAVHGHLSEHEAVEGRLFASDSVEGDLGSEESVIGKFSSSDSIEGKLRVSDSVEGNLTENVSVSGSLSSSDSVEGELSSMSSIDGTLKEELSVEGRFHIEGSTDGDMKSFSREGS